MPGINFNAPDEFHERLKAHLAEAGIDNQSEFIRQAIEVAMAHKTLDGIEERVDSALAVLPSGPGTQPHSLADAADIILAALPEHQRNLILDVARERERPPVDFILSYCKMADERGETPSLVAEGRIDEEEERPFAPGPKLTSPIGQQQPCEYCKKPITVTRRGQKYCPDPDDGNPGCGRKATLEELHKHRPQTPSAQHRLAAAQGFGR